MSQTETDSHLEVSRAFYPLLLTSAMSRLEDSPVAVPVFERKNQPVCRFCYGLL